MSLQPVVWQPDDHDLARSVTLRFMQQHGIERYDDLVRRSIEDRDWFWDAVVEFLGIPFRTPYTVVSDETAGRPFTTWFPDGTINMSEVCVDRWAATRPDHSAIIAERESGAHIHVSYRELADLVSRAAGGLRSLGVARGDTVAIYLPMCVEAVVAMLAVARLGAVVVPVFSGFAADAVTTRLADARPAALITANGYERRGKATAMAGTAAEAMAAARLDCPLVVVDYEPDVEAVNHAHLHPWVELLRAEPVPAVDTSAEDPVLLAYTSGTTGRPKGVVHVHGGFTVKIVQEAAFQLDVQPDDTLCWLTDMGWIMGPWMLIGGLGNGATIGLYDGAPNYPDPGRVWKVAETLGVTALGVSPTLIRALQPHGPDHVRAANLSRLRAFASTGEPWNPDPWTWLFDEVGGGRLPIVNISGGTEIGACLLSVNLLQGIKPVSVGGPSLGIAVDVYGPDGRPVRGEVGELVCTEPWPGMTRGFWGADDRYLDAYWRRWEGVWVHGDWASIDEDGFWYLHGRSDDTLNIAGKRIGPAEIESILVEDAQVVVAAAVGIPHPVKGEAVVAYVVTHGETDEDLSERLADRVAEHLGKAFRPLDVLVVPDLPHTRSAKIMRRVIRAKALGEDVGDLSSLENPTSLEGIQPLPTQP